MASSKKRCATRELNHENWDHDDEEKEERGVFEQARSDVLSERVIKKAKRRGGASAAAECGAGGTFAGFSGFKSTSLSSPAEPSAGGKQKQSQPQQQQQGGFEFLKTLQNNNGTNGSSSSSSSQEGKKSEEEKNTKEQAPLSELFKPKAGSWKCSVCDIRNEGSLDKCAACTTPKAGGGEPKKDAGGGSKWTCDTCLVPNAADASACVCCQTKKPGASSTSSSSSSSFSFGAKKESGATGFQFGSNGGFKPEGNKGFSFGATKNTDSGFKLDTNKSTESGGSTGFKFGSSSSSTSSDKPPSGFTFGSSTTTTHSTSCASSSPSGFKFTSTTSSSFSGGSKSLSSSGFAFKPTPTLASPISSTFKFEPTSAPSTPSSASTLGEELKLKATPSVLQEGGSVSKSETRDKYAANLRALNRQLAKWVKAKVDENPNVILSPIFSDYEKHLKDIADKYPLSPSSGGSAVNTPKATDKKDSSTPLLGAVFGKSDSKVEKVSFSTGSSGGSSGFGSFSTPSSNNTSFGAKTTSEEEKADKPKEDKEEAPKASEGGFSSTPASTNLFSFGSTAVKSSGFSFGSTSSTPSTGFSFGTSSKATFGNVGSSSFFAGAASAASTTTKKDETADEAAEDEPPKVEVKTVEESDAKFSMRCKLYYKKEKDFVDRGVGMVHLKLLDDNKKVQLLVRAETNLGNILLNIMLNDKITFTQRGNNLQFVAVPNPSIKGIPEGPVSMLLKVKNSTMAEELQGKIQEILKEVVAS